MKADAPIDKWNANLYDNKHSFVSNFGEELIGLLSPAKGEAILDIGCGTGDITHKIGELGAKVVGIDKSANMIGRASGKYPHIRFQVGNVLDLNEKKTYDGIISNATLHWVKEPDEALKRIFCSLKEGGRFVAELGGKGNIRQITSAVKGSMEALGFTYREELFPWYFPSIGEYTTLMERAGFTVIYASLFDRPTNLQGDEGLKNWMLMFGESMFEGLSESDKNRIIEGVEQRLKPILYQGGQWVADYKRLRVAGIR